MYLSPCIYHPRHLYTLHADTHIHLHIGMRAGVLRIVLHIFKSTRLVHFFPGSAANCGAHFVENDGRGRCPCATFGGRICSDLRRNASHRWRAHQTRRLWAAFCHRHLRSGSLPRSSYNISAYMLARPVSACQHITSALREHCPI